ncbi:hypothetical protein J4Q44_G00376990 [Coregonus suidteri]|uniref:Uncharacterized protein n=1 Tax=Coregonus suidteri TaxID=861788 RepID=A0AAN8KLN9_9TELE
MSVCHPTSTLDRLSSLTIGDSERKTSSGQQREPLADIPHENTGPSLVQRCVVVNGSTLVSSMSHHWTYVAMTLQGKDRPVQQPSPLLTAPTPLTSYPIRGCNWEVKPCLHHLPPPDLPAPPPKDSTNRYS